MKARDKNRKVVEERNDAYKKMKEFKEGKTF
jgi:hypothetical protein